MVCYMLLPHLYWEDASYLQQHTVHACTCSFHLYAYDIGYWCYSNDLEANYSILYLRLLIRYAASYIMPVYTMIKYLCPQCHFNTGCTNTIPLLIQKDCFVYKMLLRYCTVRHGYSIILLYRVIELYITLGLYALYPSRGGTAAAVVARSTK